ncbi:hypothetical protein [Gilvibacter sediminis]|uniref:hypothetical protein n=1 Tax=Gilvibacter sediminis TaxID=379071 RepID=UPI002350FE6B|nr:hypothetical protein [Gilvibacter sediminis]MDC7997427.1 hypothetical protein [Gilvibacter sediminis]
MRNFTLLALALFTLLSFGQQQDNQTAISGALKSYLSERQNIHLHLNKNLYFPGETIWFSAYLFEISDGSLSDKDANLNVVLYDESGEEISSVLTMTKEGRAHGSILIDQKQEGQLLYIKAFTSRMNGYSEDNSFMAPIALLNPSEETPSTTAANKVLDIQILPEGGHALSSASNTYGIKIINPTGLGVAVRDISLVNEQGEVLQSGLRTNAVGMGKFVFNPEIDKQYFLQFNFKDELVSQQLPAADRTGIGMHLQQNFLNSSVQLTVYTNEQSMNLVGDQEYKLYIQNGERFREYPVVFESGYTELTLVFPAIKLFEGVNTFTLFTADNKPVLERLIYKPETRISSEIQANINRFEQDTVRGKLQIRLNDSIKVKTASITVVSDESLALQDAPNILVSKNLKPYINGFIEDGNAYFTDFNSRKHYALDLLLLNQGWSKYKWRNVFAASQNSAENDYYFDGPGIKLKGYVRPNDPKDVPDQLLYYSNVNKEIQYVQIDKNGDFEISEIKGTTGTTFELAAIDKDGLPVQSQFFFSLAPTSKDLKSNFELVTANPFAKRELDDGFSNFGFDANAEQLDEVVVVQKPTLKYESYFKGWDGRKMTPSERSYGNLKVFMGTYGYYSVFLENNPAPVFGKWVMNPNGRGSNFLRPSVVVDGVPYDPLIIGEMLSLQDVDEIYTDRTGKVHTFIVFTNREWQTRNQIKTAKTFTLEKGYASSKEFYTPKYQYTAASFKAYGCYHWIPQAEIDLAGNIGLSFANPEKDNVKILIEGIDQMGRAFSTTHLLNVSGTN